MIPRGLGPILAASRKSFLLLGPRQTGKSTSVSSLNPDVEINLAHEATFLEFLRNPSVLERWLLPRSAQSAVLIDEIQRLPSLLNTVQFLLDRPGNLCKFYLTGSSARKLRRGHANPLPGRVHTYTLGPLGCGELDYSLDLRQALSCGTLPGIWTAEDNRSREKTLRSYAATYLNPRPPGCRVEGLSTFSVQLPAVRTRSASGWRSGLDAGRLCGWS